LECGSFLFHGSLTEFVLFTEIQPTQLVYLCQYTWRPSVVRFASCCVRHCYSNMSIDHNIHKNTTGYNTSVEAKRLHLKKQTRKQHHEKTPIHKSNRTTNKNLTSEPTTERQKAQTTKKQYGAGSSALTTYTRITSTFTSIPKEKTFEVHKKQTCSISTDSAHSYITPTSP
jgi:hypothetical protein